MKYRVFNTKSSGRKLKQFIIYEYSSAILNANKVLAKNQIKSAVLDCEILMSSVLQKDRKYVILNLDKKLNKKNISDFEDLITKRSLSKPVAYLTKKKDFWKYSFLVSDQILIPRPDTEILIENILKITKQKSRRNILDMGTDLGVYCYLS